MRTTTEHRESRTIGISDLRTLRSRFVLAALIGCLLSSPALADVDRVRASTPSELRERRNPIDLTPDRLQSAAERYASNCVLCHGVRGDGQGPASRALRPRAMDFTDAKVAHSVSDGELFHAIAKGSHGSAMAAYENKFSAGQIWELVAYLRRFAADEMKEAPRTPVDRPEEYEE